MAVSDNAARRRFELQTASGTAYAEYVLRGDTIEFTHTVVPPAARGGGVGSRLASGALDEARRRGLHVIASCPYIAAYIRRHPEYQDLLS